MSTVSRLVSTVWRGRSPRDERGAVALMVGLLSLVLVGVCAIVVDLSNAFVEKREIQARADFAALAGSLGDDLPMTAAGNACTYGTGAVATDQAIIDAAAYLNDQLGDGTPFAPTDLVDCNLANGEAAYGIFDPGPCVGGVCLTANKNQLSVISQPENVKFGLAAVFGVTDIDVRGEATVEIKTPLQKTLPLYAHSGCDYGSQTIKQPTNGQSSDGVTLANSAESNTYVDLTSIGVNPVSTTEPPTVTVNSASTVLTINGTDLDKVTEVGFFRSGVPAPSPITVAKQTVANPTGFTVNAGGTVITLTIPTSVTSVQDVWFVRLRAPRNNSPSAPLEWTPVTNPGNSNPDTNLAARPFVVGNATLNCDQGSSEGNFGTLDLFNESAGVPGGQDANIAYNIAYGLQYGLAPYPQVNWTPPTFTCVDGQDGVAITWESGQDNSGTNCVRTQTGLRANAAQMGFVTGVGTADEALLKDPTAAEKCPFDYPSGTTHVATAPTGETISNDVLTCYFTNDAVTVQDVSSSTYAGDVVIDQSIYESARFVNVPVLGALPDSGGANSYEIVDFRPAFITEQPGTATRATGAPTTYNGLVWSTSDSLQAVNLIFLNPKALPNPPLDPNGKYIPYTGSGDKVPLLVN